jgi:hypothetical protein
MQQIFYSMSILACPVGMGAMIWFMMRGSKQSAPTAPTATSAQDQTTGAELARLRAEIDQLQAARREATSDPQDSKRGR